MTGETEVGKLPISSFFNEKEQGVTTTNQATDKQKGNDFPVFDAVPE